MADVVFYRERCITNDGKWRSNEHSKVAGFLFEQNSKVDAFRKRAIRPVGSEWDQNTQKRLVDDTRKPTTPDCARGGLGPGTHDPAATTTRKRLAHQKRRYSQHHD